MYLTDLHPFFTWFLNDFTNAMMSSVLVIFLFVLSIVAVALSRETAGPRANPDPRAA